MDRISINLRPQHTFGTQEPPMPAAPDASDVQQFQNYYGRESGQIQVGGQDAYQALNLNMQGATANGAVNENAFQAALSRMVEMHEGNCVKLEALMGRLAS